MESAESGTKNNSKSGASNVTFGQAEGTEADPDDDDGFHIQTKSGRVSRPPEMFEAGGAELLPAEMNYYAALAAANCGEIQAVGAGIGGGFDHTSELKVMKYEEAINSPDKEGWKAEIKNEHRRMQKHGVWKAVKKESLKPKTKVIDSTWACKKKSNGTLRARMNARGFKQVEGEMYQSNSIAAPVTNDVKIRVVLTMMLLAYWQGQIVDINGAFLHGHFENG